MAPVAPTYGHGAVASGHAASSEAGAEILRAGGDAVDAAVATLASLGVATPQASGLGGGFFALVHRADEDRTYVLDARETAPGASHAHMFREGGAPDGELLLEEKRWGGLSVAVPGEVAGMAALHSRWGERPWADLFQPAIRQAEDGVEVNRYLGRIYRKVESRFRKSPAAAALYQVEGRPPRAGEMFSNPELAATLRRLAAEGPDWFYRGGLAGEIAAAVKETGGVITEADLAGYEPAWREPLIRSFHGYRIASMPPPSSGGLVLHQILGTLKYVDLPKLGWNSSGYLHHLAEAMRPAFADRAGKMGDADFVSVSVRELLDRRLLRRRAAAIQPSQVRPVRGVPAPPDDAGTSHVSVADRDGNWVVVTSSINFGYGSLVVVPGRGFVLNNQMDDFSAGAGEANLFGLRGTDRNLPEPGKRPLSSMCPTLVLRGAKPVLGLGASGGPRIISSVAQVILNVLLWERPLQEAVSAPRIHHQWKPDRLRVETDLPRDVCVALERRGHELERKDSVGGRVHAVLWDGERYVAASDPRKEGRPAGH
jgi:gamma-glutamyltranspeptidase/glutathione hydrolase